MHTGTADCFCLSKWTDHSWENTQNYWNQTDQCFKWSFTLFGEHFWLHVDCMRHLHLTMDLEYERWPIFEWIWPPLTCLRFCPDHVFFLIKNVCSYYFYIRYVKEESFQSAESVKVHSWSCKHISVIKYFKLNANLLAFSGAFDYI